MAKATVHYRRQTSPQQYHTAEASIDIEIEGDASDLMHDVRVAFIELKTEVFAELGIDSEEIDGRIMEVAAKKVERGFSGAKRENNGRQSGGGGPRPPHNFPKKHETQKSRENQEWAVSTFLASPELFWANYTRDEWTPKRPALELKNPKQAFWLDDDLLAQLP